MKITPVLAFALKKGMTFVHDGNRGIVLEHGWPWMTVRMYHEMKPRRLWGFEKVKLLKGSKYELSRM